MDIFASTSLASLREARVVSEMLIEAADDLDVQYVGELVQREPEIRDIDRIDRSTRMRVGHELDNLLRQLPPTEWFFPDKWGDNWATLPLSIREGVSEAFVSLKQEAARLGLGCFDWASDEQTFLGRMITDMDLMIEGLQEGNLNIELEAWTLVRCFMKRIYPLFSPTVLGPTLRQRWLHAEWHVRRCSRRVGLEKVLPEAVRDELQARYMALLHYHTFAQYGRVILAQFPRWEELTELFDLEKCAVIVTVQGLRWRNINGCMAMIDTMKTEYLKAASAIPEWVDPIATGLPYPLFLTEDEVSFAQGFKAKQGHWPVFFLLYQFLLSYELSDEKAASLVNAFGLRDGVVRTTAEVTERLRLSSYRVRNALQQENPVVPFVCDWTGYEELLRLPLVDETSPEWRAIAKSEGLPADFNGAVALLVLSGEFFGVKRLGSAIAFNKRLGWKNLFGVMQQEKELTQQVGDFIFPKRIWQLIGSNDEDKELVRQALFRFAGLTEADEWSESVVWALEDYRFATGELVVSLLKEKGSPMTHDELREGLVRRKPGYNFPADLRGVISMSPDVSPLSRNGTYALKEWGRWC